MSDTRTRCPNKHPGTRGQCGLPAGHYGDHTLLVESGTPWFTPVSPVASSATPTPDMAVSETSVICRECGTLVSGEEAGAFVRWVTCRVCADHASVLASAQQEVERYRAALTEYGVHFSWCAARHTVPGECTCGLAALTSEPR